MICRMAATAELARLLGPSASGNIVSEIGRLRWTVDAAVNEDNKNAVQAFLRHVPVEGLRVNSSWVSDSASAVLHQGDRVQFQAPLAQKDGFFLNISEAKAYYAGAQNKPTRLLYFEPLSLVDEQSRPAEWAMFADRYEECEKALNALVSLAHHRGAGEAIFIEPGDTGSRSIAISIDMAAVYESCPQILDAPISASFLLQLSDDVQKKNANYVKERSVFRSSLFEFYGEREDTILPVKAATRFLTSMQELADVYGRNFQSYISGITLEKLKTEVATEQLKFTEQASKGLLDISTRMLAVPAALGLAQVANGDAGTWILFITCVFVLLPLLAQWQNVRVIDASQKLAFRDLDRKLKDSDVGSSKQELSNVRRRLTNTVRAVKAMLAIYMSVVLVVAAYNLPPLSAHIGAILTAVEGHFLSVLVPARAPL